MNKESENNIAWVVESTGSWYRVILNGKEVKATIRGKLRLAETSTTNPIAVGDRVAVDLNEDGTGIILDVLQRKNRLARRAAGRRVGHEHILVANVDRIWVVSSAKMPRFNPGFVDRVLVMASRDDIPAGIIINKIDLLIRDHDALEYWRDVYTDAGYPVLLTSAKEGTNVQELRDLLGDAVSVLTGPSGVGKSSLLNAVDPELKRRTGDISERTKKGKHVTTHATVIEACNGYIIDTPGIREFGIIDIEAAELSHHFPEFIEFLDDCKFPNCTHDHEPECAVISAVEDGYVSSERWSSYLNILKSVQAGIKDRGR